MKITLNGEGIETQAKTLADLLVERSFGPKVATARNGDFIAAGLRASTAIEPGDQIEVLAAMQGG